MVKWKALIDGSQASGECTLAQYSNLILIDVLCFTKDASNDLHVCVIKLVLDGLDSHEA